MGDVRVVIFESVGQRVRKEEPTIRGFIDRNLESTNFESNYEDAISILYRCAQRNRKDLPCKH